MEGKGKALEEKITKYPVAASEIRTHDLRVTREKPQTIQPLGLMYELIGKNMYI